MRKLHHLTIGLFILWLASGFLGMVTHLDDKLFAAEERRHPAAYPAAPTSMEAMRGYLSGLEDWFADRVYARQQYLTLYHTLGLQESYGLRDTPSVRGRNGWLFLGNQYAGVLNYTRNAQGFSQEAVTQRLASLRAMAEACRRRNIHFVWLVAPNKHTIYSEYLPGWLHIKSDSRLADAVLEKARAEGLPFLFPKQALLEEKDRLAAQGKHNYFRDDTHWNLLGALTAYRQVRQELELQHYPIPSLAQLALQAHSDVRQGDLISIGRYRKGYAGTEDYSFQADPAKQLDSPKGGRLLLLGDSFSGALRPLLDVAFQEVTQLHILDDKVQFVNALETYKPEVVICEIVERSYVTVNDLFADVVKK